MTPARSQPRSKTRTYQIRIDEAAETPFITVSSTRDDNQTVVWAGPVDQIADPLLDGITAIEEMERPHDNPAHAAGTQ